MSAKAIPTPANYGDGFDDNSRPHKTQATLSIHGQRVNCYWHAGHRHWYPVDSASASSSAPQIQFQDATPVTSPQNTYTTPQTTYAAGISRPAYGGYQSTYATPLVGTVSPLRLATNTQVSAISQAQPIGPVQFPVQDQIGTVPGQITAKMLLDYDIPRIEIVSTGDPSLSSTSNRNFASITRLTEWKLPQDLSGYSALPTNPLYNPPPIDTTLSVNVEAEAIWATRYYIVTPVNNILSNMFAPYDIRCKPEDTNIARVTMVNGESKRIVSRVDLSWQIKIGGEYYTFAVLEFKRPGSIELEKWSPALQGQPVTQSAKLISQQLVKYAHNFVINNVGVCDLRTLVLLELHGERSQWRTENADGALVNASYRWITDQNEMKRNLYIFLYEGARSMLKRFQQYLLDQ